MCKPLFVMVLGMGLAMQASASMSLLVNPTSSKKSLHEVVPAWSLDQPGHYVWDNGVALDYDGDTAFVYAPLEAMGMASIDGVPERRAERSYLRVEQIEMGVRVQTPHGNFIFIGNSIRLPEMDGELRIPASDSRWLLSFEGGVVVRLAKGPVTALIGRDGSLTLSGMTSLHAAFGPTSTARVSTYEAYGVARDIDSATIQFPQDWVQIKQGDHGWVGLPHGRAQYRRHGDSIQLDQIQGAVQWRPATAQAEAWVARFASHPSWFLTPEATGWKGTAKDHDGMKLQVETWARDNASGMPSFKTDLWRLTAPGASKALLLSFSPSGEVNTGSRMAAFSIDSRVDPLSLRLNETGGARVDRYARALESIGAWVGPDQVVEEEDPYEDPSFVVEDWNDDGVFFLGSLLHGGFLGADRAGSRVGSWSQAWDLSGDGFADVFHYNPAMVFNFLGELKSILVIGINARDGSARFTTRGGYDIQKVTSHFSKTPLDGVFLHDANVGFEEHFFVNVDENAFPDVFPKGANLFYYTIEGGRVNRMTMGRLSGHGDLRAWEIELDPQPYDPADVDFHIVRWTNAVGRTLAMNTISVPETWDGGPVTPRDFLRGWYDMVEGVHRARGCFATFSPPGAQMGASEGMYGGVYTTQERIEVDEHGATYTLYHSPLMGDLHLKGANFGSYAVPATTPDFWLDIHRFHHPQAHEGSERYVGIEPAIRFRAREAKRMEGPVYLYYADRSGDGYMDTYLYDVDNDGWFERGLWHNHEEGVIQFREGDLLTAWPETITFTEELYLPDNYDAIGELYRRGFTEAPWVARTTLGSSGRPVLTQTHPYFREWSPDPFVVLPGEWQVRVAVDTVYRQSGEDAWRDFTPRGVSRLGTMFFERGIIQDKLAGAWTDEALANVDVLILTRLDRMPTDEAVERLLKWIEAGGRLIVAPESEPLQAIRFTALGEQLGYTLAPERLERRTVAARWTSLGPIGHPETRAAEARAPGPWNAIRHFSAPAESALLDGFTHLSFMAYPVREGGNVEPLLQYQDDELEAPVTLVGRMAIGSGHVLVSGADWFSNRFIWHHEHFERGTQNERLTERFIDLITANVPVPQVAKVEPAAEALTVHLSGKGGPVLISPRQQARATGLAHIGNIIELPPHQRRSGVTVDGEAVDHRFRGNLLEVNVPSGARVVQVHYETVED